MGTFDGQLSHNDIIIEVRYEYFTDDKSICNLYLTKIGYKQYKRKDADEGTYIGIYGNTNLIQ
jgi:hypothetical protein